MSIYYFRNQPISAPLTINSNHPSWDRDSISLMIIRTGQAAQRWELSFSIKGKDNLADYLISTVTKFDTVETMTMPQLVEVEKATTAIGGVTTSGAVKPAGATSVAISGLSGILPAGSFIQFSNHSKIYITKNTITNSGTLQIYPALVTSVPASNGLRHAKSSTKPQLNYIQSIDNTRGISFSDGILMDAGTVNVIEVL